MLLREILVTAALASCAFVLMACGQKGDLMLPRGPAAAQRATLPQIIGSTVTGQPVRSDPAAGAASAALRPDIDSTGTASPLRTP